MSYEIQYAGPCKGADVTERPVELHAEIASLREQLAAAQAREPVAWIRRWAANRETPQKELNENGRMAWPFRFKLLPVSAGKLLSDDLPLVIATTDTTALQSAIAKARGEEREQLLASAVDVRLRFAKTYQENINAGCSPMSGNLDWIRLEGAVSVIQALQRTIPAEPTAAEPVMFNGLTEAETSQSASVAGLVKRRAYNPDEAAVRKACEILTTIRESYSHWGGWSGIPGNCNVAINLLRYGKKTQCPDAAADQADDKKGAL